MIRCILISFLLLGLFGCSEGLLSKDQVPGLAKAADQGTVYYLPRSLVTITVTKVVEADKSENFIMSAVSQSIPDTRRRYVLAYDPNSFYSDRFCIARTPNGLLQGVQFAAEDKTQQVVFNITRFIAAASGGPAPSNLTSDGTAPAANQVLTMTIDPESQFDVQTFNNALKARFGREVSLVFPDMNHAAGIHKSDNLNNASGAPPCGSKDICYLTKRQMPIQLVAGGKPRGASRNAAGLAVAYVEVVNRHDIGSISVERAALVERVTKMWFQDGALVGVVMKKPSEAEAASLLPLNVVKAAVSTPSGMLAGAFGDTQNKVAVANALGQIQGQQSAISNYFQQAPVNVSNAPTAVENRQTISCSPGFTVTGGSASSYDVQ